MNEREELESLIERQTKFANQALKEGEEALQRYMAALSNDEKHIAGDALWETNVCFEFVEKRWHLVETYKNKLSAISHTSVDP